MTNILNAYTFDKMYSCCKENKNVSNINLVTVGQLIEKFTK